MKAKYPVPETEDEMRERYDRVYSRPRRRGSVHLDPVSVGIEPIRYGACPGASDCEYGDECLETRICARHH